MKTVYPPKNIVCGGYNNEINVAVPVAILAASFVFYLHVIHFVLVLLRLNVPVNNFFCHVGTETPLSGYYQYF